MKDQIMELIDKCNSQKGTPFMFFEGGLDSSRIEFGSC